VVEEERRPGPRRRGCAGAGGRPYEPGAGPPWSARTQQSSSMDARCGGGRRTRDGWGGLE
jgi:hypothetical protein